VTQDSTSDASTEVPAESLSRSCCPRLIISHCIVCFICLFCFLLPDKAIEDSLQR